MLLGIGISCTIVTLRDGGNFEVSSDISKYRAVKGFARRESGRPRYSIYLHNTTRAQRSGVAVYSFKKLYIFQFWANFVTCHPKHIYFILWATFVAQFFISIFVIIRTSPGRPANIWNLESLLHYGRGSRHGRSQDYFWPRGESPAYH